MQPFDTAPAESDNVLRLSEFDTDVLVELLDGIGLTLETVMHDATIPGSFWGDEEAGLQNNTLFARADTPVHSIVHESGHYVCMDPDRRNGLNTNAGGDYDEENAVCYWQIAVTDRLPGIDRRRMCADMDTWGYTFRLGSAAAWFEHDAEDAREWLAHYGLIDTDGAIRMTKRDRL